MSDTESFPPPVTLRSIGVIRSPQHRAYKPGVHVLRFRADLADARLHGILPAW